MATRTATVTHCELTVIRNGYPTMCARPIIDPIDEVCDRPGDHEEED